VNPRCRTEGSKGIDENNNDFVGFDPADNDSKVPPAKRSSGHVIAMFAAPSRRFAT